MKKTIYLVAFVILAVSCKETTKQDNQNTKNSTQTDEQAIAAVEEVIQNLFDEVWAGYDENAVTKYQTEDFLLLEHGEIWNNDTIVAWCKTAKTRNAGTQRINNFERISAKRNGDKLWMAYHNNATIKRDTLERQLSWLESVVAVKKDSVWKLEMMHSTRNTK